MAADAINLAGVIGTWIAVFFAIVALVGVVGPLFIYMNQHSQRSIALNNADDPSGVYIGRGVRLCCTRERTLRIVRAPILTASPNTGSLFNTADTKHKFRSTASTTGWILLSDVLWNYNFNLNYGDELKFTETESYLPVHKNWILVLGLLGRYGCRKDLGLPVGDIGSIPSVFLKASRDYLAICGTSGVMLIPKRSNSTTKLKLHFHRHALDENILRKNELPLQHLLFLYLGYLPSAEGVLFWRKYQTRKLTDRESPEFFRLQAMPYDKLDVSHRLLFRQLGVHVQSILRFEALESAPEDWNKIKDEIDYDYEGPTPACARLSRYFSFEDEGYSFKADIHLFNLNALDVKWSPYAIVWKGGPTMFDSMSFDGIRHKILSFLIRSLSELPESSEKIRLNELLRRALKVRNRHEFSRTAARLWYDIDIELRKYWHTENISMRATTLLFLDSLELAEKITDGLQSAILDMDSNTVRFIGEGANEADPAPFEWTYFFDFSTVFAEEKMSGHAPRTELSIIQCAIAALQGLVREEMFKNVVLGDRLSAAYDALNDIAWVADSTSGVTYSARDFQDRDMLSDSEDGNSDSANGDSYSELR